MIETDQQPIPTASNFDPSLAMPETPSWLLIPPTGGALPLPVQTHDQLLPLENLAWQDFERLCLRLLRSEVGVGRASLYGLPGQGQQGIDAYAIRAVTADGVYDRRRYVVLQSRRIKNVTGANVEHSVGDFLKGNWAEVSKTFIYATSSSTRSTQTLDKVEFLANTLAQRSIEFEVWDKERISEKLKQRPDLVNDFFGRHWVTAFNGDAAASQLGARLDVEETANLRKELARIYTTTFGLADPGYVGVGMNELRRVELLERFVTPDLVSAAIQDASYPFDIAIDREETETTLNPGGEFGAPEEWNSWLADEHSWSLPSSFEQRPTVQPSWAVERRPADQWVGSERLQVIIGDPGAGKSALLRYLVLDLLSHEPQWKTVAEKWGDYLPVWLPFHFLAQKVVGQTGESASVGLALKEWLEQNESSQIWPLFEKALADRRLLLVVDGLDEWTSDEAGRYAAMAVERFAEIRGIPVLASTRPYGLTKLTLAAGWVYSRIAPLTYDQQRFLAIHYFRAASHTEGSSSVEDMIERSVDEFLAQVHRVPELTAFSGTPLFLILLVMLRLSSSSSLPVQRFDVYDRAVQLLVADLPYRRRTAADITTTRRGLPDHELRAVLRRVSYVNQLRGNVSTLEEDPLRDDFVSALQDPEHLSMGREDAVYAASQLLDVAEGELGLLVRTGPKQLGFIHRVMQEQLVAEYIANHLEFEAVRNLFSERVGDPVWKEVLLIAFRILSRPSELMGLVTTVRDRIDETPTGLCAREFLAEITFGPYGIPANAVQTEAAEIIDVVETHAYGPHRARLLDAVLNGIGGSSTDGIVHDCLERWTLLVRNPDQALVDQIARIPSDIGFSDAVCHLLVFAIRNSGRYTAFDNACTVAVRCSTIGTEEERSYLRDALMAIQADPPSGLVQAAALTALALGWRQDASVNAVLTEARYHSDEQVRLVAISDVLGVWPDVFPRTANFWRPTAQGITDTEKGWLIEHVQARQIPEVHFGMLVAAASAAVRNDQSVLDDLLEVTRSDEDYLGSGVARAVILTAFGDDAAVVEWVCDQVSGRGLHSLRIGLMEGGDDLLARTYHGGSLNNGRVAEAIEHSLTGVDVTAMDRELFTLAGIDHGPVMKAKLLQCLAQSSVPHWPANALSLHWSDDPDVRSELRSVLMGDPERASMIANVACSVLDPPEVIHRLMDILRGLSVSSNSNRKRYDIVAAALIQSHREQNLLGHPGVEDTVREAISLMPESLHWIYGEPRLDLALAFYPADISVSVLEEYSARDDRRPDVFLHAFRNDPEKLEPYLSEAAKSVRSLPAYLRARVCRTLFERGIEPTFVARLTRRWADEKSDPNKSVASFVHHQSLLKVDHNQPVDQEGMNAALARLHEQASATGPDYEARRRAAWVGMCVLRNWSAVVGRMESVEGSISVNVNLLDYLNGPDRILLQQIAATWEQLRSTFGEDLIVRLSGMPRESRQLLAWDSLALVASDNPTLERDLEHTLATNPELRTSNGIFLWTVQRERENPAAILDSLSSFLRASDYPLGESLVRLLSEPERMGLTSEQLQSTLERVIRENQSGLGIELLALLFPDHPTVHDAWQAYSRTQAASNNDSPYRFSTGSQFALFYAVSSSDDIVAQIRQHHHRLCKIGIPYLDRVFAQCVSYRLRRDTTAASRVRETIMDRDQPDSLVAVLAPLLRNAVGLDDGLLTEVTFRISQQDGRRLATVVRDHQAGTSLPVRSILVGVAEGSRNERAI